MGICLNLILNNSYIKKKNVITNRYADILKTEEFKDIDSAIAAQFLQVVHRYHQGMNATDSWFDASCPGYVESLDADGDQLLNWKGKGYRTVLDLLMVRKIDKVFNIK